MMKSVETAFKQPTNVGNQTWKHTYSRYCDKLTLLTKKETP